MNPIFQELEFQGVETIREKYGLKLIGEVHVEKTYRFGYLIKEKKVLVGNLVQGHYENKSAPISFNIYNERIDELEEESERISSEIGELNYIAMCRSWTMAEYLEFIRLRRALGENRWEIRNMLLECRCF